MADYWNQFKTTVEFYVKYRPKYPPALFDLLRGVFTLDGQSRQLDMGCGPGPLLAPLAPHVGLSVGVDPEEAMLAEARTQVEKAGLTNVRLVHGRDDQLPGLVREFSPFRIVTMGRSFHWMDRPALLRSLEPILDERGGVAVIDNATKDTPRRKAIREVLQKYVPESRSGSRAWQRSPIKHEVIIRPWAKRVEIHRVEWEQTRDLEAAIGETYSRSTSSPEVLGERCAGFERDLREALLKIQPSGVFVETQAVEVICAWPK
ncbi:MAG: class I SAM-dependent methyltransferase [Phycisphaerae bacterium]